MTHATSAGHLPIPITAARGFSTCGGNDITLRSHDAVRRESEPTTIGFLGKTMWSAHEPSWSEDGPFRASMTGKVSAMRPAVWDAQWRRRSVAGYRVSVTVRRACWRRDCALWRDDVRAVFQGPFQPSGRHGDTETQRRQAEETVRPC